MKRNWRHGLSIAIVVALFGLLLGAQLRFDPLYHVESEYHRLALEIERHHPWADVISLGKQDTAVWCYVDVSPFYADPGNPYYNIFALAGDVVKALEQIIDENTEWVIIGHMLWDEDAANGEGRYAIRQPWFWTPGTFRFYGALYPAIRTTMWYAGYLAPDSYRWIGNPYATWWIRVLCRSRVARR